MKDDESGRRTVQGSVAIGFESVRQLVEREIQSMEEENLQLCVFYKGRQVVDLWAASTDGFSPDSLVNVFSSGKSLAAIAIASLVGRGHLAYDARIADHWPEFAENGKGELTVSDLMRHECGLAAFETSIHPEDLHVENIKQNRVGAIIERHPVRFRKKGGPREYHAVTRDWIANELFRRADPAGRTIGEWLREEISGPLQADAVIGVPESDLHRISRVKPLGFRFHFWESLKPRFLGRKIVHHFFQILGRILRVLPSFRHATSRGAPPPFEGMRGIGFFNQHSVAMGETPSAAANCSARGLGKIAAMMAARGRFGEHEFLNEAGWKALHADPVEASMGFSAANFTQGGVNAFKPTDSRSSRTDREFNEGRAGFYGWMGLGGSIFQWHPEHEIGFAYVPTALHVLDIFNERGKRYQAEVLRCVERLTH